MSDTATTSSKSVKRLAGDRVLHLGDGPARPLIVTRVMPTIIICGIRQFDREDGKALGAPGRIVPATPENVQAGTRWRPNGEAKGHGEPEA